MSPEIRRSFAVLALCLAAVPAPAQQNDSTTLTLNAADAQKHLQHKIEPVYPAIARAAHIQGSVVLQASVDDSGHVVAVKVISGPPMLRQAAVDAVKQWRYEPFTVDGKAEPATAQIKLDFAMDESDWNSGSDSKTAAAFFPLFAQCRKAMSGDSAEDAASQCGAAALEADSFQPDTRYIERREAYVFDAAALLRFHKYAEAETIARKAVAVVREGHDDNSGTSAAYAVLGNSEGLLGRNEVADVDLTTAENYERDAISNASPQMAGAYKATLKTILLFHADLLDRMDRKTAGQRKRDEAATL
jgi:TonB family protein